MAEAAMFKDDEGEVWAGRVTRRGDLVLIRGGVESWSEEDGFACRAILGRTCEQLAALDAWCAGLAPEAGSPAA